MDNHNDLETDLIFCSSAGYCCVWISICDGRRSVEAKAMKDIMAEPARAAELLVRQEEKWLA
jgi:hypothetical protein